MPRHAIIQLHVLNRIHVFRNNNNNVRFPLIHMRDHLFHTAFVKVALIYASIFSERGRKIIEFLLLTLSFLSLVLLSYIHLAFIQTPTNCLEHVQDTWPRDGILRVEILKEKLNGKYTLEKSYLREKKIKEMEYIDLSYFFINNGEYDEEDYNSLVDFFNLIDQNQISSNLTSFTDNKSSFNMSIDEGINSEADDNSLLPALAWTDDEYIMEFSLEYGFLKLSPSVRKQYNISVELVTLNPAVDKCFGGALNSFILYKFLGYDEVILASLKLLASREEYRGYVRNVLSEVEFVFVNAWMDKKAYITAGFVMMVFTVAISILLRYSHHQIFVFIVEVLHMFELQSSLNFPAGPLLTVILALVGMEAIMSEFFNDTAIAFYVILIVWMADQYDTICCKSVFTKKHWLRFFYLYHFFFYAYSYRFGHNRFLALLTSWLFTLHSMVYFFHRYELPILSSRNGRRNETHERPPPNTDPQSSQENQVNHLQEASSNHSAETPGSSNLPDINSSTENNDTSRTNPAQPTIRHNIGVIVFKRNAKMSILNSKVCSDSTDHKLLNQNHSIKTVIKNIKSNVKVKFDNIILLYKKITKTIFMNIIPHLIVFLVIALCRKNLFLFLNMFSLRRYEGFEIYK